MTSDPSGDSSRGPYSLREFLLRNSFPTTKQELLARARSQGLDPEWIRDLEILSDGEYDTLADVGFELGGEAPI